MAMDSTRCGMPEFAGVLGFTWGVARRRDTRLADLLEGLEAVPFHGAGHRGRQGIEFGCGAPTDGVVFGGGESDVARPDARKVDHADVLVSGMDAVDIEKAGCDESPGAGFGGGWTFADEFDLKTAFLAGFAEGGLFGILVEFDVASEGKPAVEFTMMDDENSGVVNDEDGDGEIDFLVDMGHGVGGECGVGQPFCILYSLGRQPVHFLNVFEKTKGLAYPTASAMCSSLRSVVDRRFEAWRMRR